MIIKRISHGLQIGVAVLTLAALFTLAGCDPDGGTKDDPPPAAPAVWPENLRGETGYDGLGGGTNYSRTWTKDGGSNTLTFKAFIEADDSSYTFQGSHGTYKSSLDLLSVSGDVYTVGTLHVGQPDWPAYSFKAIVGGDGKLTISEARNIPDDKPESVLNGVYTGD